MLENEALAEAEAEAAAHTAEHIFIRSLQRAGVDLVVHLVTQDGFTGKVKLKASKLTWGVVVGAMEQTNLQIAADLRVVETEYPSVEMARKAHPELRARKERLESAVRVITIGSYDWATCAHSHAKSSGEARCFAVSDFHSLAGDSYEVSFVTGPEAYRLMARMTVDAVEAARHLRGRHDALAEAASRAEAETSRLKSEIGALTSRLFSSLEPSASEADVEFYVADIGPVSGKVLSSRVGGGIASGRKLFALGYSDAGRPSIVMACGPEVGLDCSAILRETLAKWGGKGGGKPNFALGGGESLDLEAALREIEATARAKLRENT